jgi:hypothetical protein
MMREILGWSGGEHIRDRRPIWLCADHGDSID